MWIPLFFLFSVLFLVQLEKCAQDLGSTSKAVGSSMAQLLTCAAQGNQHYTGNRQWSEMMRSRSQGNLSKPNAIWKYYGFKNTWASVCVRWHECCFNCVGGTAINQVFFYPACLDHFPINSGPSEDLRGGRWKQSKKKKKESKGITFLTMDAPDQDFVSWPTVLLTTH